MDWTNVYAESGEEEFIHSARRNKAPRLSRLVSTMYHLNQQPNIGDNHHIGYPRKRRQSILDEHEESYGSHRFFTFGSLTSLDTTDADKSSSNQNGQEGECFNNEGYSSYTLGALYCLTINYVLGVGCLGVPFAFARAGFVLCGAIIGIVTVLSFCTVMWVSEVGTRAEAEVRQTSRPTESDVVPTVTRSKSGALEEEGDVRTKSSGLEMTPLNEGSHLINSEGVDANGIYNYASEDSFDPDHYEVIDLVSYFLGPFHAALYQFSLLALMYVGLLAYSQVFCGALSALMPIPKYGTNWIQILPQLIFGTMVVPLSCLELDEQISIQFAMAIVRFLSIFIMVGGAVIALLIDENNSGEDGTGGPPYFAPSEKDGCLMNYTACFSGFGVAFSTALFSQLFQHSVPGLIRPLKGQTDKIEKVPFVFGAALSTTCTLYILLGISAASYFGADTQSSINLNFANFTFGLKPETSSNLQLAICRVASSIVVMFPAVDTLSVFPLIANTLGNNLLAASSPGFLRWIKKRLIELKVPSSKYTGRGGGGDGGRGDEAKSVMKLSAKIATIFWRLVASIPPLFVSFWANDLSFSLLLAGVAGIYVAFFAPSMLQLVSRRREKRRMLRRGEEIVKTCLPWYLGNTMAYGVIVFATFALCIVLVQIRDAWKAM